MYDDICISSLVSVALTPSRRCAARHIPNPNAVLASVIMDGAVWTAIGLLAATSLGTLFYLGSRIDALGARVDALSARMDSRFDAVSSRFDALEGRMEARFTRVDERFDALEGRPLRPPAG